MNQHPAELHLPHLPSLVTGSQVTAVFSLSLGTVWHCCEVKPLIKHLNTAYLGNSTPLTLLTTMSHVKITLRVISGIIFTVCLFCAAGVCVCEIEGEKERRGGQERKMSLLSFSMESIYLLVCGLQLFGLELD